MTGNLAPEVLASLSSDEMDRGASVCEPLAQDFTFAEFPMRGSPFEQSPEAAKREFYLYKKSLLAPDRACPFLVGHLFDGHFTPHGQQSRFHLGRFQFEVKSAFVNSIIPVTLCVQCHLVPEAEAHPNPVIKMKFASFVVWNDPARRLGIRMGGVRKGDQTPDCTWTEKNGDEDTWLPRLNMVVDWLEGRSPTENRPLRWYPGSDRSRSGGTYTRHPMDFVMDGDVDLFHAWDVHVNTADYRAW
jgi:hypothetical protein